MRHAPKAAVMLRTCINAKIRKNLCIAVREKRNLTEVNRTGASIAAAQKHKSILAEGKTGIEICSEFSMKNLNSHRSISLSLSLLSVFFVVQTTKNAKKPTDLQWADGSNSACHFVKSYFLQRHS